MQRSGNGAIEPQHGFLMTDNVTKVLIKTTATTTTKHKTKTLSIYSTETRLKKQAKLNTKVHTQVRENKKRNKWTVFKNSTL